MQASSDHPELAMARSDLQRSLHGPDSQRPSIFPIRLLSTEILQLVFLFAVSHQPHEFATYIKRSAPPRRKQSWAGALSLSWVCSLWRRSALSCPAIWCSIHIDAGLLKTENTVTHAGFAEFVEECLRRSGSYLPLAIGLNLNGNETWLQLRKQDVHHAEILKAFSHIADYAGRLRRFNITSNLPRTCEQFTDIVTAKMAARPPPTGSTTTAPSLPYLEEIEFECFGPQNRSLFYDETQFQQLFTPCPSLRFLRISSLCSTDIFDLRNLLFLRVSNYVGFSFGSLLVQCPRLKYLGVDYFDSAPTSDPASTSPDLLFPSIVHHHLTRLCLTKIGEYFPLGVWTNVCLPNLIQLGVAFHLEPYEEEDEGFELPSRYFEGANALEELKVMCIHSGCLLQKIWVGIETHGASLPRRMHSILREFPRSQSPAFSTEMSEEPDGIECEAYLEYLDESSVRSC
ncbi:hypothetical protein C8R42DRAFT_671814 [Lentinula raphanica]|nr:hypothetical protein C8R42DRAFT_671814 [Lentinula raphanica]